MSTIVFAGVMGGALGAVFWVVLARIVNRLSHRAEWCTLRISQRTLVVSPNPARLLHDLRDLIVPNASVVETWHEFDGTRVVRWRWRP